MILSVSNDCSRTCRSASRSSEIKDDLEFSFQCLNALLQLTLQRLLLKVPDHDLDDWTNEIRYWLTADLSTPDAAVEVSQRLEYPIGRSSQVSSGLPVRQSPELNEVGFQQIGMATKVGQERQALLQKSVVLDNYLLPFLRCHVLTLPDEYRAVSVYGCRSGLFDEQPCGIRVRNTRLRELLELVESSCRARGCE